MVQQDIAAPHMEKEVRLGIQRYDLARHEALVAKVRPIDLQGHGHETGEVQRSVDPKDILLLEIENI